MFDISLASEAHDVEQALYANWVLEARKSGQILRSGKGSFSISQDTLEAKLNEVCSRVAGRYQIIDTQHRRILVEGDTLFMFVREKHAAGKEDVWEIDWTAIGDAGHKLKEELKKLVAFRSATLQWWYMSSAGPTSARVALDTPRKFEPKMYPMKPLNNDPIGFMKRYYDSQSSILFLLGPPGTGKTSLIRQFLWLNELNAYVAYDEKVLRNDAMFIEFMGAGRNRYQQEGANIMVLEDVTELLQKREMDKNEMMARFLNVSDGLIQMPNKKIIFTTNLASLKDVDPALLRPGRCFDVVEMRPLFYEEAIAACEAAGLPIPMEHRDYYMSELYNQGREGAALARKVGFA